MAFGYGAQHGATCAQESPSVTSLTPLSWVNLATQKGKVETMVPTRSERQDLAKQFANDVARMRQCLRADGKHAEDDDLVLAWADYSDSLCAGWLGLPAAEKDLLAILLKHLPPTGRRWRTTIIDARDGTGDGILSLPEGLLAQIGWKKGDTLSMSRDDSGDLIIRRVL
jgi:hypothetical protein